MRLNDFKIGTQLRFGLGVVLVLVVALSVQSLIQSDLLGRQTEIMYEHPLQIRTALGRLATNTEGISRHLRDLFVSENEPERTAALQNIETDKADMERQFAVLYDRYLGPKTDLDILHNNVVRWNILRDETVRLFREGKMAEAEARVRPGGIQAVQADVVRGNSRVIDTFVRNKAEELYQAALALDEMLNKQVGLAILVILLLSFFVTLLLLRGIKTPLKEISTVTEQFRQGNFSVRCPHLSTNEFGLLAASFNTMADTLQAKIKVEKAESQLAEVLLRKDEIHAFTAEMLKELLRLTGSQVGAVYFLNSEKTSFECFESIGLGPAGRADFSAVHFEGELGTALAARRIQHITDIPENTRFTFAAVSGEFSPRAILTIPILSGHTVSTVISLASVRAYDESVIRLLDDTWSMMTARINGVLAFREITDLAIQLEHQNSELEAQKQELSVQAAEVAEQNTELEMQKHQLNESNRLKSAFLSNMSHELRTPLNSVIALSGVLSRRLANTIPADEYSYLGIIERNGKNLLLLINGILDLSRIEAGREEISVTPFSVREQTEEIVTMIQPQAGEKKIALINQVTEDLPQITSDPVKFRHILQNLVSNAVKFTRQGNVTITARQVSHEMRVTVADTGIGIDAIHLAHIFDEFRQADGSTSREFGGTGLGLAIARKYAQLLAGRITVESTPKVGSSFTLHLPLVLDVPDSEPVADIGFSETAHSGVPLPGNGQTILVVEDNEPAVIQLTDILQTSGYRVQTARNGREAAEQIAKNLPDAVILDLMMPEVDGFQTLREIRSTERTAKLPILILTAKHVTKEDLSFLKHKQVCQLIQKGDINKAGLLSAVAGMVAPSAAKIEPPPPPPRHKRAVRSGMPVILVVEDNPDNMETARALLNDSYQVIEAENGQVGVEMARTHCPDLILMDIALPVIDGLEALTAIRADKKLCHIPVIAATASAMTGDKETLLAHGFDGYISKPIDADLLKTILHEALD